MENGKPTYYLHVGPPKTGTTFLQAMLHTHRTELRDEGVLYPHFQHNNRFLATLDARDQHTHRGKTYDAGGQWQRFVDRTKNFDGKVTFSNELLSAPHSGERPTALRALDSYDTHIILTARDPGRQLPSCWQQTLRHTATLTFHDYIAAINADGTTTAGRRFEGQRLDRLIELWGAHLPADHIHVVVVPPRGADPLQLWSRFATLLDIEPERYAMPDGIRPNPSFSVAQIELLRRVSRVAEKRFEREERRKLIRRIYVRQVLPLTSSGRKPMLPGYAHDLAHSIADVWIDAIRRSGVDVIGDVEELRPGDPAGDDPDTWDADEVIDHSAEAIIELLLEAAKRGA